MTDSWKTEEQRQSTELANIIQKAINDYGLVIAASGKQPILNAVAGALVSAQGHMLASIADARHRRALRNSMERALPNAIANSMGKAGRTEVVIPGRFQ